MRIAVRCAVVLAMGVPVGHALALTPDQVFERVSPSVWSLRALDAAEKPIGFGSAVVIAPGRLITACSVLARARSIQVRRDNTVYEAKLEHPDTERNLCQLHAQGLLAPAAEIAPLATLKVGQRVYLVSVPQKFSTSLAEGLIGGLGAEDARAPPIQTGIAVGPGSAGGGLFDADARLLGIAMPQPAGRVKPATNAGFAVPADWIREVPERATAALARRREQLAAQPAGGPNASASASLPAVGATWKYTYADRKYSIQIPFTLRVTGVEGWNVHETLSVDGAPASQNAVIGARDSRFVERLLNSGRTLFEFAPYLLAAGDGNVPPQVPNPTGYPVGVVTGNVTTVDWTISAVAQDREQLVTPAGGFNAHKFVVTGTRLLVGPAVGSFATRFQITAWYAAEAKRYVMLRHQTWDRSGAAYSDEVVELQEYRNN